MWIKTLQIPSPLAAAVHCVTVWILKGVSVITERETWTTNDVGNTEPDKSSCHNIKPDTGNIKAIDKINLMTLRVTSTSTQVCNLKLSTFKKFWPTPGHTKSNDPERPNLYLAESHFIGNYFTRVWIFLDKLHKESSLLYVHTQLHTPLELFWFGSKGENRAGSLFQNGSSKDTSGEGSLTISCTWVVMATACTWGYHHFNVHLR